MDMGAVFSWARRDVRTIVEPRNAVARARASVGLEGDFNPEFRV